MSVSPLYGVSHDEVRQTACSGLGFDSVFDDLPLWPVLRREDRPTCIRRKISVIPPSRLLTKTGRVKEPLTLHNLGTNLGVIKAPHLVPAINDLTRLTSREHPTIEHPARNLTGAANLLFRVVENLVVLIAHK